MSGKKSLNILFYTLTFSVLITGFLFSQVTVTVDEIVYDLLGEPYHKQLGKPWGEHEGLLHGASTNWDWYWGARPGAWMDKGDNKAVNLWGQVYEWKEESPETNIRIQVRNMTLYALVDGTWRTLSSGNSINQMEGSNWKENYQGASALSDVRSEKNNGGGMSFNMVSGYIFHWWVKKWPRAQIPEGVQAFYSVAEMRLIPNTDPNVDLSKAGYLAGIGNDYYTTPTIIGSGPWPSLAIARHKFITAAWQPSTADIVGEPPTDEDDYYNLILSHPLPPGVTETSVKTTETTVPTQPVLHQNYPNPFNPTTTINYKLPKTADVKLEVYNLKGRLVATLVDGRKNAGAHHVTFTNTSLPSGAYVYKLTSGDLSQTRKMLLLR